jgi:tripartite-type tricarboxylate transporter receptor subunit TctC
MMESFSCSFSRIRRREAKATSLWRSREWESRNPSPLSAFALCASADSNPPKLAKRAKAGARGRTGFFYAALTLIILALEGASGFAHADDYPSRPITLIVPFPPGGSTTVMARIVADKLSAALGQQIVVENRGGAGGTIGTRVAAKATPDGYTILLSYTATLAIAPAMNANAGYDPRKELTPIGMIGFAPNVLVVHPSLPVRSIAELIAYAKTAPAPLQYGSPGVGTVNHLAGEYLANETGIKLQHVPYKGNGPAVADLLGGHIPMMFLPISRCSRERKGGHPARASDHERAAVAPVAGFADACRERSGRFRRGATLWVGCSRRHPAHSNRSAKQGT